jgi:hypothetical protein
MFIICRSKVALKLQINRKCLHVWANTITINQKHLAGLEWKRSEKWCRLDGPYRRINKVLEKWHVGLLGSFAFEDFKCHAKMALALVGQSNENPPIDETGWGLGWSNGTFLLAIDDLYLPSSSCSHSSCCTFSPKWRHWSSKQVRFLAFISLLPLQKQALHSVHGW